MRIGVLVLAAGFLLGCQAKINQNTAQIGDGFSVYDPKELAQYIDQKKLTEEERKTSIEALRTAFKSSYVGYDLKKALIGKSGDEIFDECLKDTTPTPLSTVEYYDEIKKCLARLKDTHISVSNLVRSTTITTGISSAIWIGDKLIIETTRPKLLEKFEEMAQVPPGTYTDTFQKGTWIEEINGRPAIEAVQELEPYISASSPMAAKADATYFLFTRSFRYPKTPTIQLKVRREDGVVFEATLPWVQRDNYGSADSATDLNRRGFALTSDLAKESLTQRQGYSPENPLFQNLLNKHEYFSEQSTDDYPVVVTGQTTLDKQNVCYLQVSSFSLSKGTTTPQYPIYESVKDQFLTAGFIDVIRNHLQTCETLKSPLILDIRQNGGGDLALAAEVFSFFETFNGPETYQGRSLSTRTGALPVLISYLSNLDLTKTNIYTELSFKAFQEAQASHQQISPWVFGRLQNFEKSVFNGKVLVLTGPQCVSACDNTARRFKISGRGTLVGEPTNGTGFGFISTTKAEASFRDPYNLYTVRIPNSAFHSVTLPQDKAVLVDEVQKGFSVPFEEVPVLENRPTVPDVELHLTRADLFGYSDYIQALVPLLKAPANSEPVP